MGTCVSFDGDLTFIGDASRGLRVFRVCDEEDLKKEKLENT